MVNKKDDPSAGGGPDRGAETKGERSERTKRGGTSQDPSVTRALSVINRYAYVDAETMRIAAEIGTETHRYALAHAKGFAIQPPPSVARYVEAWDEWLAQNVEEVLDVEVEVFHPVYRYVGHVDMIARLRGDRGFSIFDLKRVASVDAIVGLQLAGYKMAAEHTYAKKFRRRLALHINADARWRAIEFKDVRDEAAFLAALSLHNHLKGAVNHGE